MMVGYQSDPDLKQNKTLKTQHWYLVYKEEKFSGMELGFSPLSHYYET